MDPINEVDQDIFPSGSGSIFRLEHFDDEWFKDVNVNSIAHEIEQHFERLLER
jgi:hypothetical protein